MTKVDVILPCYNPNDKWPSELLLFHAFISPYYQVQYILVNDGSISGDINLQVEFLIQNSIPIQVINYSKNRGKGFALRQGVFESKSDYVIYTDIDFPFVNQSSKALIDKLVEGNYDVVAGYRDENYYLKKMSWFRRLLSRSFRAFMKTILKMPVSDTQCGLKGFNKKGRDKFLTTTIDRYLFDFEFIYTSNQSKNVRVSTVPVYLKENISFSKMRLTILIQELINLFTVLIFKAR